MKRPTKSLNCRAHHCCCTPRRRHKRKLAASHPAATDQMTTESRNRHVTSDWYADASWDDWGHIHGNHFKTVDQSVNELVEIVGKHGVFLINIDRRADGTIPLEPQAMLRGIGACEFAITMPAKVIEKPKNLISAMNAGDDKPSYRK